MAFCCVIAPVRSQVIIQFTSGNENFLDLHNIWRFQLNNVSGAPITCQVQAKITKGNGELVGTVTTPRFELQNGISELNNDITKNAKSKFRKGSSEGAVISKNGYFPKGLYYICIVVTEARSDAELGQNCQQINVTVVPEDAENGKPKKKENWFTKNVGFSGYSEITGVYSNMQAPGSLLPPSYVQWYCNPTVSVYGFPVSAKWLVSSRQNNDYQNINYFNIEFDANRFASMLKERALGFIKEKVNVDNVNSLNLESYAGQLNDVTSQLQNPAALTELGQLQELDSLKSSLAEWQNMGTDSAGIAERINSLKLLDTDTLSPDTLSLDSLSLTSNDTISYTGDSLTDAKIDSLKQEIEKLDWLEKKRSFYDDLLSKKDELEGKLEGFNLDSLTGNLENYTSQYDASKLNNPEFLFGFLKNNKLFKKFEKFMMAVKKFSLGTSFPQYTDLTFKGTQVNGLNIELEKWNTNLSFVYGDVLQGIIPNNLNLSSPVANYTYRRNVIGGSIGYGPKDKYHVRFTLLSFEDDPTSIIIPDSLAGRTPRPQSNQVMSLDFKVKLFKNRLSIFGELAGSQTIRDITLSDSSFIVNPMDYHNPREWFANIFLQRTVDMNTSVDFAFKAGVEGRLFKGKTILTLQTKRVGPGFQSFGNPFMINDIFNIEAKVTQKLWKNRISISGFVRRNVDNLDSTKLLTSQLYNFGFDFSLRIPKWPSLRVSMTPYLQQNDSASMDIQVLMASSNYSFKIKKVQVLNNLTYMHQQGSSQDSLMNFHTHYATLLNSFLLSKTVSLNLSQSYFFVSNRYGDVGTYSANLSGSVLAFKKWNNTIGALASFNQNERRYGGYYQTGIQFLKYLNLNIRVEYSRYDIINPTITNANLPFDQIMLRGVLITRW